MAVTSSETLRIRYGECQGTDLERQHDLSSWFVDERTVDSELTELVSEAFEDDRRASLSEDAADWTDADSPEHQLAEHDNDVSVNSWRKVVARSEQLRKETHPPV